MNNLNREELQEIIEQLKNENGIKKVNGSTGVLQKQIDLMHQDVLAIRETVEEHSGKVAANETRSVTNQKLFFVLLTATLSLAGVVLMNALA